MMRLMTTHCLPSSLIVTGRSKGYAFIEYKHKEDADYAWEVKIAVAWLAKSPVCKQLVVTMVTIAGTRRVDDMSG